MKIDIHCHTSEGSPDSIVDIAKTIETLKEKGYDGMIVTDHNSYQGYNNIQHKDIDFVVLKGIEYDTSDAGHMIIVLPTNVDTDLFTHKGMEVKDTIKAVHNFGGIIGPAHPFDYYKLGILNNAKWIQNQSIVEKFDFIEGFNSCGSSMGNNKANKLAKSFNLPIMGGSDSHRVNSVGKGWTKLPKRINNETEFIELIKESSYDDIIAGGELFNGTTKDKHKNLYAIGIRMFYLVSVLSFPFTKKKALSIALAMNVL